MAGENSWCARRYSLPTFAGGLTCAARTDTASRALAIALGGTSTIENAVQPTTVTAASVAATAHANMAGSEVRARRGCGASTVGSAASAALNRAVKSPER